MAYKNVHLTESEANDIAKRISDIGKSVENSGKSIDDTMTYLIENSKGEEIDLLRDLGKKLIVAIGELAVSALDMGIKIGEYIKAMINNDRDAAQKIKDSIN